ncbi:hypothetical protein Tco_0516821 [Tanacetum coccineum]
MQDTGVTNSVSPMYGSTTNPIGENCIEVDGQSSQQSEHEYINLDDQTVPTQDTNEDPGERDIGNNNGEDELELKSKRQKTSKVWGDFIQVTLPDDEMFIYMMKTANPLFERISRPTAKADCFKVYEHEKKKLKALTNALSNISLTTDCWRSSHQKIEYMVITGHFIDQNWRLQKTCVKFSAVPPPSNQSTVDIADGIYK